MPQFSGVNIKTTKPPADSFHSAVTQQATVFSTAADKPAALTHSDVPCLRSALRVCLMALGALS